ncbi:AbrB family transcriptional regulator [Rhodoblastus sphagnicola]|uniref:AbrB family transcriptional regulator n=1 Tax=Rhodoblastus sphagnicola TaxID=333368 RepID=A0A2S6N1Z9_9HYPH|nr:AbrB/MazE/SpoVT family DNA-binding domain-containing protein [Rhodoblastus sphagnicola]MBB4198279.1 antitoxin VapB [Rhodoblastus sphagnicola]PPQ28626.1 AbrB family transcriptional regulator [Rhodoblastus sphagnicola]
MSETAIAKLFMHGRSQAVRLPKEFRMPGAEVKVSRIGDKVILEPIETRPFDAKNFWAAIDSLTGGEFPDVGDDDLHPNLDDDVSLD